MHKVAEQDRLKAKVKEFEGSLSKAQKDASAAQDNAVKVAAANEALQAKVSMCVRMLACSHVQNADTYS
jgi:predicted  nucleic acid-binding Zn-ribbon protein